MVCIRPANDVDLRLLADIERAAGEAFRALDMDAIADDDPFTIDELAAYQQAGRAFVADDAGRVVGYLLVDRIGGAAHIEQVTVHPGWAHQRIGRDLIDAVAQWGAKHALTALTLTTYEHVPWNAPYYARLGFTILPDAEQSRELQAVRRSERERGLDAWPRVVMHRPITQASA